MCRASTALGVKRKRVVLDVAFVLVTNRKVEGTDQRPSTKLPASVVGLHEFYVDSDSFRSFFGTFAGTVGLAAMNGAERVRVLPASTCA